MGLLGPVDDSSVQTDFPSTEMSGEIQLPVLRPAASTTAIPIMGRCLGGSSRRRITHSHTCPEQGSWVVLKRTAKLVAVKAYLSAVMDAHVLITLLAAILH